jgi:ParB family chromosome partitioning protein
VNSVLMMPTKISTEPQVGTMPHFSLIPTVPWTLSDAPVAQMPIASILLSPNGDGKATDLDRLVTLYRARGVLVPLIVAPNGRLLAGRRRLEAARRAGLTTVPVRICEITNERAAIEISLVENVEWSDLDPLTRARSYHALIEQGASVEEIAELVGQGTGHVYQHLQLLDLHAQVQEALHTRTLSFADARALAPLELEDQAAVFQEIRGAVKPLTSRQVKARVDARRVMRLVRQSAKRDERPQDGDAEQGENVPQGKYAALFETEEATADGATPIPVSNPLDELNALIAEMIATSQGEDQVRAWARRLSHILEKLRKARHNIAEPQSQALQERLL